MSAACVQARGSAPASEPIGSITPASHYAAAKGGVIGLTKSLAREVGEFGVRVNALSPGPTDTEIFKRDASAEEIAELRGFFAGIVPIGRMGTPEEVANAALFLASDQASFINGVDLYVDGGCVELKS